MADEMTTLAEKCCKDVASPDCYDKGVSVCPLRPVLWLNTIYQRAELHADKGYFKYKYIILLLLSI